MREEREKGPSPAKAPSSDPSTFYFLFYFRGVGRGVSPSQSLFNKICQDSFFIFLKSKRILQYSTVMDFITVKWCLC